MQNYRTFETEGLRHLQDSQEHKISPNNHCKWFARREVSLVEVVFLLENGALADAWNQKL